MSTPNLPPFFAHLCAKRVLPRDVFVQQGLTFGYKFVATHAETILEELPPFIALLEQLEADNHPIAVTLAADISYLRTLLAMHRDALAALANDAEPPDSFEAYLNGLYDFWPRFKKVYEAIARAFAADDT